MKLYFVKSGTGYNYIMAETDNGILCNNCAPGGKWGNVDINGETEDYPALAALLYEITDPDLDATDLAWMGAPCYDSLDEWDAANDALESWQQDTRYLIGEFPRAKCK